jgi:exonuclease SbcC
MIRRIILQNYMSHPETVIEPAAGLTVLVGPNNCGKSAVVSALETLCNNASGDYMVRHDEKEARVTVETADGHTFVWRRRGKVVSYIVDDREIHRVGRTIPDDLHKFLRLPKVEAGENGDPFDIHFGTQKSPIFLLNEPESRAALFFASSSDAAILLEMQRRHRNNVKERKNDDKRLKAEIGRLDAELGALAPLKPLAASVEQAEEQYQMLKELAEQIRRLMEGVELLSLSFLKHNRLARVYECLAPLKPSPQLADPSALQALIADLPGAERGVRRESALHLALHDLVCPPELGNVSPLSNTLRCLTEAEQDFSRWSCYSTTFNGLQTPPELDDSERLESIYGALSQEVENRRLLYAKATCLSALTEMPVVAETGHLKLAVMNLDSAQQAHVVYSRQQSVCQNLTPPPQLADSKLLADLLSSWESTIKDINQLTGLITSTEANMLNAQAHLEAAERARPDYLQAVRIQRRRGRGILISLGVCAVIAALILLITFGPTWLNTSKTGSSVEPKKPDDLNPSVLARANNDRTKGDLPVSRQAGGNESPGEEPRKEGPKKEDPEKEAPKKEEPKQEGPKKEAPRKDAPKKEEPKREEPKKEAPKKGAKKEAPKKEEPLRLKQVRQLLHDAEMANEKGKYLDAVLGYGQAAILFPEELAEVESPEKIRLRFMDALKQYQAEVERALQKAGERKLGDK